MGLSNQQIKKIRLSGHALKQLSFRGTTEEEIKETIRTKPWGPSELGRLECRNNFAYNGIWNGKYYTTKQVRPIFVEEEAEIIVVTVYVYYF